MISLRVCVCCHKKAPKEEFIRVVKQGADYVIDDTYNMDGRGCYICKEGDCASSARKKNALKRSFKAFIPDQVYQALENYGKE